MELEFTQELVHVEEAEPRMPGLKSKPFIVAFHSATATIQGCFLHGLREENTPVWFL